MRFSRVTLSLALIAAIALPGTALADYLIKQGDGTTLSTVFSFVCQTTKLCPATVLVDPTGAEKGTNSNPLRTDPTGTTTQPVSGSVSLTGNLPGFASTPTFNCGTGCGAGTSPVFSPAGGSAFGSLTATATASASTALPSNTGTVEFYNGNSVDVSCTLATGTATGLVNNIIIPAGRTRDIGVGSNLNVSCINQTGSASNTILMAGGSGGISGFGGSGGTGGGGAITAASGAYAAGALSAGAGADGWDATQGTKADAAYSGSGSGSVIALLKWIGGLAQGALPSGTNIVGKVGIDQTTDGTTNGVRQTSQYPTGATAVQGSATGTTAATSAALAATVSVTNYVCSISIRANATAAATGNATLSDGTKTFNFTQWTAPNANGLGVTEEIFTPCYPASAANTAWTLTSAAPGAGGVVSVAIAGYQK